MGVKKQETLFPDFLFRIFANSGGYTVVVPRKQICSLSPERSLCKWDSCCPALSFSVGCISRWQRFTGSLISSPGKTSAGEWGGSMVSRGIISARGAMAFSTAFSSVSLNVSMTIFPTNTTSRHAALFSQSGTGTGR